ncbi:B-cell receptor CD22-like, partial [Saccostrea cucullata]|uniref:B-cell receptor CD22-like n=1 Tax=Saccostrea cuccullata TaxID=36930 RepID=UPI002ED4ED1A
KRPPEVTTCTFNPYPITEGHTATLACSLTAANPRESIKWSWVKSDQPDNVFETGSTYSIPNIKRGQAGRYECRATNSIGTSEPVTIEIDVQYKPEVTSTTSNPYPITEGHTATLACSLTAANPRESINWSWVKSDEPDNVLKTGSTYSIPNIKRGQSGRYECRATNSIGTSEPVTIEIDVQYKPEVCSTCTTQGSYKIIEGQTATFICKLIAANPNTGVTWRWFKADLPSNILHSGPTFTLPNIQREQSGTYWCTASNIIGISYPVTIHVAVQDIPAITIQGYLEVVCGETACIKAEIQQEHSWSTTWYRVTGGTLKQIDSDTNKYAKTTNRKLVIQRVSKDDQGEYQAIITGNPFGQYLKVSSEVFTLKILGERPILQKLEASLQREGISFHYEYEVLQGSPKANCITWTRNGETLIIDHDKYIGGDIKNNSLTIKFPTMQDIGKYTCTISNAVGAVSKSLIIDEDLLIGRWASNLKLANVGKWNNLVGSPPTSDLESIKKALNNSDPPQEVTEKLMENSTERNWPTGLHTRQKREENSELFERFKTRKIKGKQAVVILFFENKHMPEDLIKKPGIVITFCGGVK